jgi:ribosomal protein S18 acetylase RimI-like enzyme
MPTTLRPADGGDAALIADLHVRTARYAFAGIFPPDAPPPTAVELTPDWERKIGHDRPTTQVGFVAEDAGAIVGVVVAGPDPDDPALGHLSRLYVDPTAWRRGIGRLLYERAIRHLSGLGYREVTLWVLEGNGRARRWYESLGWQMTSERKPTYAPAGIDDVRYRLVMDTVAPYRAGGSEGNDFFVFAL